MIVNPPGNLPPGNPPSQDSADPRINLLLRKGICERPSALAIKTSAKLDLCTENETKLKLKGDFDLHNG